MPRKVLISFLGTGHLNKGSSEREYSRTTYEFNNKEYTTSIVALALKHFIQADVIYLFGTMGSAWEALYLELSGPNIDSQYVDALFKKCNSADASTSLDKTILQKLEAILEKGSVVCPIKYGVKPEEVKENFNIFAQTLDSLQDNDEVFLDISNSFRSLPLFATTALSYIQDVSGKKVKLAGIYYGMFEAKDKTTNKVPIVDLSYINQLQDWIKGAHSLMNYGNGYLISDLMKKEQETVVGDKVKALTDSLLMNYMHEIKTHKTILTSLQKKDYVGPAKLVLPTVFNNFVKTFSGKTTTSQYQFALAKWHFEKKLYAEAYLALVESIVSYVCEQEKWLVTDEKRRNDAKGVILNNKSYKQIKSIYAPANNARKSVAHVIEDASQKAQEAIKDLADYITLFETILLSKK